MAWRPQNVFHANKHVIVDSNFAPAAATWRTRRNIGVDFNYGPLAPLSVTSNARYYSAMRRKRIRGASWR